MIISVISIKGGAGKSSLAQMLAVYLRTTYPDKELILVDADPQKTSSEWVQERNQNKGIAKINCTEQTGNIVDGLQEADSKYDFVIVDTGGSDSKAMRSALAVADVCLIPCRPKRRDIKALIQLGDLIDIVLINNPNLTIKSVITQAPTLPSQGNRIMSAKAALKALELNPMEHITCNRNSWDDSDENGLSVLEYEDEKARDEAEAVCREFFEGIING